MLMRDEDLRSAAPLDETSLQPDALEAEEDAPAIEAQAEPVEPAPPITSRFMFVNVAGMRARQLRAGAFPRLEADDFERLGSSRAERVAMEEVRQGLVYWDVPDWQPVKAVEIDAPRRARALKRAESADEHDSGDSVAGDAVPANRRRGRRTDV